MVRRPLQNALVLFDLCSLLIQSVTLHTDLGDIKIELQCEAVPKACEVSQGCSSPSVRDDIIDLPSVFLRISLPSVRVAITMTACSTGERLCLVSHCDVVAYVPPIITCMLYYIWRHGVINTISHLPLPRNIKEFMVQTGDPTGTGKGGTSIWGKKFEDTFSETLKVGTRAVSLARCSTVDVPA